MNPRQWSQGPKPDRAICRLENKPTMNRESVVKRASIPKSEKNRTGAFPSIRRAGAAQHEKGDLAGEPP
jgi:hypothetical protein